MARRRPAADPAQLSLLDWRPDRVVRRFAAELIRAAGLAATLCRGLKLTLEECCLSRAEMAARMSAYLGESIPEAMVNAYVSQARDKHVINVVRFIAFTAVTGDHRTLNALLDGLGLIAIEKKYLPWAEIGMLREQSDRLNRRIEETRRRAIQGLTP